MPDDNMMMVMLMRATALGYFRQLLLGVDAVCAQTKHVDGLLKNICVSIVRVVVDDRSAPRDWYIYIHI